MTVPNQVQGHPASVDAYIRHGWKLVPIPPNTKGPQHHGWNKPESSLNHSADLPPGWGIGIAHAYSGTMALDVDEWDTASSALAERGIDLKALYDAPDAVAIESGKPGHGKLLYRMPFGLALPSKKITIRRDGANQVIYELRCATSNSLTVQDVLPPSVHPEIRQPYRWGGRGNWMRLPEIPLPLLVFWQSLLEQDSVKNIKTDSPLDVSWDDIRTALNHVSPDCSRDDWVTVGMGLHWAGTHTGQEEQAFQLWDEWSAQSPAKYKGQHDLIVQWRSFKPDGGKTLGSLFHLAQENGWQPPRPSAAELFGAVNQSAETVIPDVTDLMRPPPPDINLDHWPSLLVEHAAAIANQKASDPLVSLFAGLGAVCGAVDSRIRLELMRGFKVPPVLWLMTIGDPAEKKSPGSKPMFVPLSALEAEDRPRYKNALLMWEGQESAYNAAKNAFLDYAASPESHLDNDAMPVVPDLAPPPVPKRLVISDVTSQKMVRLAADRPEGLLCHLDEMRSWADKLNDSRSGEDRSAWVQSYEADGYLMDRVGSGSIYCDNLAISIYGNIQPQVYRRILAKSAEDGLLQRFIPAVLREQNHIGDPDISPDTEARWEQTIRMLHTIPAITYTLSPEAYAAYREFQHWYLHAKKRERVLQADQRYMTAFGKMEGTVGRLALVFHLIENPYSPTVTLETMSKAINAAKDYVIPSLRYAMGEVGALVDNSLQMWINNHILHLASEVETVTLRDLKHSARRRLAKMPDAPKHEVEQNLRDAMFTLERVHWVSLIEDRPREGRAVWAINPALATVFKEKRESVIRMRQEQLDEIVRTSKKTGKTSDRVFVKGYDPSIMDKG